MSGTAYFLEWKFRNAYSQPDILFYNLDKKAADYTHVYIGDSHIGVFHEYSSDSTAVVRNLSNGGQDLFKDWVILKKWAPQMKNLKFIMVGVEYELLGHNQTISGEEYLDRQFFKYTDTLYRYSFSNVLMAKSNFFRANRNIGYVFTDTDKKTDLGKLEMNYTPLIGAKKTLYDCRKRAIEHSVIKFNKKLVAENLAYLQNIIQICKELHIHLLVMTPPKAPCYDNYVDHEVMANAKHLIDSVTTANKVDYLDFYPDKDFQDDAFIDFDHLTPAGVKKLINKIPGL